jgi:signal transduction histidine kinase
MNTHQKRVEEVYTSRYQSLVQKTDRLFGYLFVFQWLLGIALAFWVSPSAWSGVQSEIHIHIFAAIFLGAILASIPTYLIMTDPGATINRMVVAFAQMLFSVLLIHLTGGRIETHFHVFGSLAFLAIYRDWRVLAVATFVTAADHLLGGMFSPTSVYGVLSATPWRALEHSAWVIFEDAVLFYSIKLALAELWSASEAQVNLEHTIESIEDQVRVRTTELLESQKIILEQQEALVASSKMSALGEMAGGVAHEINNPLAIIKALCNQIQEVVDDEHLDKGMIKDMAAQAENTTDRIGKIIAGMRSFSRNGNNDPYTPVCLYQVIEDTLGFCGSRFTSNGVTLTVEQFDRTLTIEGRATQISQVILNLLNNAFDATERLNKREVSLSVVDKNDFLEIRVSDSGSGIPVEIQNKIFQPFFTTKEIGKGTGMGLSISIGIIKSHRGSLSIDREVSNTCFVICLPKKQEPTDVQKAA